MAPPDWTRTGPGPKITPVNRPLYLGGGTALLGTPPKGPLVCAEKFPGEEVKMKALGRQLVVELWGCERNLNEPEEIRKALQEAVDRANATGLDIQRCIEITWRAHVEGRAVVARAQQAEAEHIAEILHQGGLIAAVHPCEHTS